MPITAMRLSAARERSAAAAAAAHTAAHAAAAKAGAASAAAVAAALAKAAFEAKNSLLATASSAAVPSAAACDAAAASAASAIATFAAGNPGASYVPGIVQSAVQPFDALKAAEKQRRAEERRMRNRASAAKCNARAREALVTMQATIAANHVSIAALTKQKAALEAENSAMRKKLLQRTALCGES